MLKEELFQSYFYKKNGQKDKLINSLVCFNQWLYVSLKREGNLDKRYYANVFLTDINLVLTLNPDDNIIDLYLNTTKRDQLFNITSYVEQGKDAIILLEDLLMKYNRVIVQSVFQKVPQYLGFNPNYNMDNFIPAHSFLVIWQDKDYFYYVDQMEVHNLNLFKACKENKEVGIIEKSELEEAFKEFFKAYIVEVDNSKLPIINQNVSLVHKDIIGNYSKKSTQHDNKHVYFGRGVITKLIELCSHTAYQNEVEKTLINNNIKKYIDTWFIVTCYYKRQVLLLTITNDSTKAHSDKIQIINILQQDIDIWILLSRIVEKKKLKNEYILDKNMSKNLKNILLLEDKLIELLKDYWSL